MADDPGSEKVEFDPNDMNLDDDSIEKLEDVPTRGLIEEEDDDNKEDNDVFSADFGDGEEDDAGNEESGEAQGKEDEGDGDEAREAGHEAEDKTDEEDDEELDDELTDPDAEDDEWERPDKEKELLEENITKQINGERETVKVKDLLREAQKAEAADQRFAEAAHEVKNTRGVILRLKEDPLGVCYQLLAPEMGEDGAYAFVFGKAREVVAKQFEYEQLDDKDREKAKLEQQLERAKLEKKAAQDRAAAHDKDKEDLRLANLLVRATKKAGIKTTRSNLNKIAKIYDDAATNGAKLTMLQAAKQFREAEGRKRSSHLRSMSLDDFKNLPEETQKLILEQGRQARIETVSKTRVASSTSPAKTEKRERTPRRKVFDNYDDARKDALAHKRKQRATRS